MLSELVKKREKEKLKVARIQQQYMDMILNPITHILRPALDEIKKYVIFFISRVILIPSYRFDLRGLFHDPVNLIEVPDYGDIVKNPMDFATMKQKLENHEYRSLESFKVCLYFIFFL